MRLPVSTSLTRLIERSWPIASGVSVSGNGTLSRSGRIGNASGRFVRTSAVAASPSDEGMWILIRSEPAARCRPGARAGSRLRGGHPRTRRGPRRPPPQRPAPRDAGTARARSRSADRAAPWPALAGDEQLAAADLEGDVGDVHPRQVSLHDRARRVVGVEDVHGRGEAASPQAGLALEDVAEELVDLAPHALEVREQIALLAHGARG